MGNREIAEKLADYCKKGKWLKAQSELYSPDAVSIEPGDGNHVTKGLDNLNKKVTHFNDVFDINNIEVSEPIFAGDMFAISIFLDAKKKNGEPTPMEEIAIYEVQNGKIVREQFF